MSAPTTLPQCYDLIGQMRAALLTAHEHIERMRDDHVACCTNADGIYTDANDESATNEYDDALALIESALERSKP